MAETQVEASSVGWRSTTERAARRLAAITAVGGLLGLLVGGVGGRLATMLLARLNPSVTGVTSDDGFRIGQFTTADTITLLLIGSEFGVVGAGGLCRRAWPARRPALVPGPHHRSLPGRRSRCDDGAHRWGRLPAARPAMADHRTLRSHPGGLRGATALGHPVMALAVRLGLAAIFVLSLVDLGRGAAELM